MTPTEMLEQVALDEEALHSPARITDSIRAYLKTDGAKYNARQALAQELAIKTAIITQLALQGLTAADEKFRNALVETRNAANEYLGKA